MSKNVTWNGSDTLTISAEIKFDHIVEQNAKRCANHLIATSPTGIRKSKNYKYGWRIKKGKAMKNLTFVEVWNETNWQLTWLLENGHLIVNKKGGVGWASAVPHIQQAIDFVKPQFIADMQRAEIDIDFQKG